MFQQRSGSAVAWVQQQLAAGTFGRPLFAHALTLWHRDEAYLGWGGVPLGPELAELLGIPVAVLNDVRALTLGEHWFGAGPICTLGHRGCVFAFMTNAALLRTAGLAGETYEQLVNRARLGDTSARRAFTDAAYALGQFAAQLADIMDPEVVIITGDGLAIAAIRLVSTA